MPTRSLDTKASEPSRIGTGARRLDRWYLRLSVVEHINKEECA